MCQKDIHFAATLCVAVEAGLDKETALLVAWANQQVDETALTQVKWLRQMFINSPGRYFHFIPGDDPDRPTMTTPNSAIIQHLVKAVPHPVALGMAVHGLLDSYAHQNFYGHCTQLNNTQPWLNKWYGWRHYGHTGEGHAPDNVDAVWWDGRIGENVQNRVRFTAAMRQTYLALGGGCDEWVDNSSAILILCDTSLDYEGRKAAWVETAGFPGLRFSDIQAEYSKKYSGLFKQAAAEQKRIVKEWIAKKL